MTKKTEKHAKSNAKGAAKFKDAIHASNGHAPKTAPGHKMIARKRYTQALAVRAAPEEVAVMAEQMAKLQLRKDEVEATKREANAEYREELAGIKDQLTKLAVDVQAHTKTEEVECVEYLDEATHGIRVVRTDTGEEIEYRAADKEDLQESMFDSPQADAEQEAAAP